MLDLLLSAAGQFGLPIGLLLVAVSVLGRVVMVQHREAQAVNEKRIAELEAEVTFYREKWLETLDQAEVGTEATRRLAGGKRRPGGTR